MYVYYVYALLFYIWLVLTLVFIARSLLCLLVSSLVANMDDVTLTHVTVGLLPHTQMLVSSHAHVGPLRWSRDQKYIS